MLLNWGKEKADELGIIIIDALLSSKSNFCFLQQVLRL
jgi:hypothetical protein